jgi:Ca-activated chloride channel homolog
MFKFGRPDYLYLLYLIPVLLVSYYFIRKKLDEMYKSFANEKLHRILSPMKSRNKPALKYIIFLIALTLIIVSLARPQIGSKIEEVKQMGIDVVIVLDVSMSMQADDIKPDRLEKAKHEVGRLIEKLQGDRIGLVIFSGNAYVQFPLTSDYAAANLLLNAVDISSVPQPGTSISSAIQLAVNSFKTTEEIKKTIIIISDGEDHEGEIDKVIDEAVSNDISIYTIGLGNTAGSPIPVYNEHGAKTGFKTDNSGKIVITKLDETVLKDIASKGNGKYYKGSNNDEEIDDIFKALSNYEQTEYGTKRITDYEDRYYFFLIPALLLLIGEFFISSNRSKLFEKFIKADF